jgi:autotransporter-associated beta strand protein
MKRSSILFACVFLFNLNTFSQSIFISDLVLENSIDIEHVSIQKNKVTIQSHKDLILPSKVIESYINQGFEVVVKSKKDIDVSAFLSFNAQSKNQFKLECEDKGQILFRSFSGIASQNHPLNLRIKTKGNIIVKENVVLNTNGGEIRLQAFEESKRLKKNATNKIEVFGTLNASSKRKGGKIILESDDIQLSSHSKILSQGNLGGGVILIGGDWQGGKEKTKKDAEDIYEAISVKMEEGALLDASALSNGNGGKVVLWSNLHHPRSNTMAQGQILAMAKGSGKGGIIETSGGAVDFEKIKVSTIAADGSAGEWLIDPWNFFFNSTQLGNLASNLGGANITISTGSSSASGGPTTYFGRGYIVFDASLTYTNSNARTLTLSSNADIWIKGNITSSGGALSLSFNAPSDRRIYLNGDVSTNGGTISVNNSSQINFQKTTGTQTIASNGGAINFSNSNIRLLRHSGTLSINSGSGQLGLGGSGSVEQVNTFFDISSPNTLVTWGGAHTLWDNVNGGANSGLRSYGSNNIVSGREYALKLWFWDSWDGGEGGEVIVRESSNTAQYYFRGFRTHNSGFTSHDGFSRSIYQINSESHQGRTSNWVDQNVEIYFQAQHNGTLQTYANLNSDQNDESLEVQDLIEISFPTTTYSSDSRSLELISTSGQLACGTKNFNSLASVTFNTNNNDGFVEGIISGTTNVIKSGTGHVRFSGANTYSGTTTVSAGTYRFVPLFANDLAILGAFTNNGTVTYETGNVNSRPTIYLDGGISGSGTWNISSDVAPASIWNNRLSLRSTTNTSGQINISSHGNLWLEGSNINMTSPIFTDGTNARLRLYGPANATMSTGAITGTGTVDFSDGGGGKNLTLTINTGSTNAQFDGFFVNSGVSVGPTVLNISKNGTGAYTLTANNTFTGTTTITAGTLVLQNNAPNPSNKTFNGTGQLRIEPSSSSFTSGLSTSGWTFSSNLTGLTIGKELNTANITIGSNTSISGPISVYGGNITINENLNTSSGNANGDILLKASADISIGASKSITTNGGDVTFWADHDATSGGTISLLSAASIQTSGGRIVLAGGLDNGSNSGISNDGIPDGYARGVGVSGISTTGSFSINSGSGSIFMKGSSNNRDGISLSANSSLTGNIISTSGNIDLLGFVENGSIVNGQSGGFIQAGIRTSGGGTINIESNTGTVKTEGNAPRYGLAFGVTVFDGTNYFASDGVTQTIIKTANTSNNAISIKGNGQHGISFRGLATKIHATAALGGITLDGVSPNWSTTIYNPVEILSVSGPINWQNSTSTDGVGIFSLGSIAFGSKSGVTGLTSSNSNININIQKLTSGASPFAIATSGQVSILGVNGTSSFGQAFSTSSFGLNANSQTMTGFTFGAAANTENLTFGQNLTVAGPITAYGGTLTLNENISSSNGSTISLFGNGLSFASGKTVTSSGQLIVAPQTASNTIGLGGASGTLQLPATYFSTNFSDGFSNIQIGSNTHTGAITSNAFTLRDNVTLLTTGSLTLGGKPILGNNNVTLGSAISSISGTPTHYFQTNGTGTVKRSIGNNTNLVFPIGNAFYNPLTITNKTGTLDDFSARVFDAVYLNGTSGNAITKPHVNATWDIYKTNANAGSGIDMQFSWDTAQERGRINNFILNHHSSGWKIAAGTTGTVSGTVAKTITHTGYTGSFSPFAFGNSATPLPVELISFNATCMNDFIQIKWTTASEKNNKMFELYKSDNAIDWSLIHTESGQGDKASETNYQFMDSKKQAAYYRLKDIDFDGIENWSPIIFADCENESSQIEVYPNPATDYIKVIAPIFENTTLHIISLEGKVIKTMPLISNQTLVSVKDLASGMYMVEINNSIKKIKFIKN